MPPMRRKGDLPTKVCPVCGRQFTWRKRWAKTWDAVIYCSDACRKRKAASGACGPALRQSIKPA